MDDAETQEIRDKINALVPHYKTLDAKMNHVQSIMRGLENLITDTPKNTDCTDMTDSQLAAAKTNLFRFADEVIGQ